MRERKSLASLALLVALGVAACASAPPRRDPRPIARDPVCAYFNDLGCIDVAVDSRTPCASYRGKKYYFCSEHCREMFEAEPRRFVADPEESKRP
jgi:YHS domain-containing protein